jgi:hypothetical protein
MIFFYIIARRKGKSLRSHGCVSQDVFESMGCSNKSNIIWLQSSDPEAVFDLLLLHERVIDLLARTDDADLFEHINSEWIRVLRVWHKKHITEGILAFLYHFVEDLELLACDDSEDGSEDSEDSYENSREEVEVEIADEGSDEGDEDDEGEDNHEDE